MKITTTLAAIIAALSIAFAPEADAAPYERKSVSYLNALLLTDSNIQINSEELDFILKEVETKLSLERFDYNPLPDTLIREFLRQAHAAEPLTLAEIDGLLQATIVPMIERLLEEHLEQRAEGLVGEEGRIGWAAEKAKSLGITSVELEKVLNSAYIYFPVLSGVNRHKQGRIFSVDLTGTVMWYRLFLTGEKPELKRITSLENDAMDRATGYGRAEETQYYRGNSIPGKQYSFFAAAEIFARNMEVKAREFPEFKLAGIVREAGGGKISFDIGSKEGVALDDKFLVTQVVEDESGIGEEKVGLVQVTKVGFSGLSERQRAADTTSYVNIPTVFSEARIVTGRDYDEGMAAVEYPRLGLDVGIGLHNFTIRFGSTDPNQRFLINTDGVQYSNGIGLKLSAHYNTAKWSKISQFYLMLEGGLGIVGIDATDPFGDEIPAASYHTIAGGAVKKFSWRRLSIPVKALVGLQAVEMEGWWSAIPGTQEGDRLIRVRNSAIGLIAGSGFEYLLTPAGTLQLGIEYRLFSRTKVWDLIVNEDFDLFFAGPSVDASGYNIGLTFVWSPPKLSFDPANIVKTAMGI